MLTHRPGAYYMPTTPWTARPKQDIDKDAYFRQIQRIIPHAKSIICGAAGILSPESGAGDELVATRDSMCALASMDLSPEPAES